MVQIGSTFKNQLMQNVFQYILGADKYCLIPLIWGTQNSQIHGVTKYIGRCQGPGGGGGRANGELMFKGDRVSV